ncbi:MAG: Peptidase M23B, partial [Parcubacteria group bacterium GW2011_GWA2_56_7]
MKDLFSDRLSHLAFRLKQLAVHSALVFLRGLVFLRRSVVSFGWPLFGPIVRVFGLLGRRVVIVSYRVLFGLRRHARGISSTTKRSFFYLLSHRFVFHVLILAIVTVSVFVNINESEVRAEGFGERSTLFHLVRQEFSPSVEVVVVAERTVSHTVREQSYFGSDLIQPSGDHDTIGFSDEYASTTGGSLIAPVVTEAHPSIAARKEVVTHIVQEGETLGAIAERYGVSVSTLLWANNLSFRSLLKIGQGLAIPPVDGVIHTVRSGDTISAIARR